MSVVNFLVDGTNMYHALMHNSGYGQDRRKYRKYLWLSYRRLAEVYVTKSDVVGEVFCFIALRTWDQKTTVDLKKYANVLRTDIVDVEEGFYKKRDRKCSRCGHVYKAHEDKCTHLGLAVKLFEMGMLERGKPGAFDSVRIVTGNNDFAPAIETFRNVFPDKPIGVVLPIGEMGHSTNRLRHAANFHTTMTEDQLKSCQFEDEVTLLNGKSVTRPETWK